MVLLGGTLPFTTLLSFCAAARADPSSSYRIFQNHTQQITPEKNTPEKKTIDLDTPHNFLGKPMDFGISPFIDARFFGGVPFSAFLFWV